MFRILLASAALGLAPPALACPGGDCDVSHCQKKAAEETTTAMSAVDAAEGTKLALSVKGMKCGACADKVTAALKALDGVNEAAVSVETAQARVAFDEAKLDEAKLLAAITELGFEASKPEA